MPQPLFGVYHSRIIPMLEQHLREGRYSVLDFISVVRTRFTPVPDEWSFTRFLVNINTRADYTRLTPATVPELAGPAGEIK